MTARTTTPVPTAPTMIQMILEPEAVKSRKISVYLRRQKMLIAEVHQWEGGLNLETMENGDLTFCKTARS
jgi:hypothetical protein